MALEPGPTYKATPVGVAFFILAAPVGESRHRLDPYTRQSDHFLIALGFLAPLYMPTPDDLIHKKS